MTSRCALAVAAAAVAFCTVPGTASAHAYLVRSDPADGTRLASPPPRIQLWFSEAVSAKLTAVKVTGARSGTVRGTAVRGSGTSLVISLPDLPRDTYSLYWLTVSTDDLHVTRGLIAFSVGTGVAPPPSPSAQGGAPGDTHQGEVVLRWLDFAAIAGLIGALALVGVCLPAAARRGATGLEAVQPRLAGTAVAFAAAGLFTGAGLLLVQAAALSEDSTASAAGEILLRTSSGPFWIAREVLLGVLLAVALVLGRRRPGVPLLAFCVLGSAALCGTVAATSHAAALRGHVSVATGVLALHLFAAAVWTGGVFALALVLVGRWRTHHGRSAHLLLRSFGGLAALAVAVVAITGVYSAGVGVVSPDALILTFYGRVLLAKTLLMLLVAAFGLGNSFLVRTGRDDSRWFGRGVRLEAALAGGVILLAAVLTASAPARGPRFLPPPVADRSSTADANRSVQAGDLLVTLSVKPNQPGVNFLTAGVFDTRRPPPAPVRAVDLAVDQSGRRLWRRASQVGEQYWQLVGTQLARSGPWSIGVRIHRPGMPDQIARVPWTLPRLRPQIPVEKTVLSKRPLAPILSTVAAGAALLLTAVLLLRLLGRWLRHRRTSDGVPSPPATVAALPRPLDAFHWTITVDRTTPAREKPRLLKP